MLAAGLVIPAHARSTDLVWIAADRTGKVLDAERADSAINPASVVKLATTLWALERLGPEHRFTTRFGIRGTLDPASGVLEGDLIVLGAGDPDFHVENAYLVARALNRAGLRRVEGSLLVDELFWIGWEGGSERPVVDAAGRGRLMATRLRDALDPERWDPATRRAVADLVARRRLSGANPRVTVAGAAAPAGGERPERVLAVHRSNPLVRTLKRFNAYSNNDIERLAVTLGPATELSAWLADRWEVEPSGLTLQSLSGLGTNRLTPRLAVRLLQDLGATAEELGISPGDLLPAAGCDPGTLDKFPGFVPEEGAFVVAKTGTLVETDGGTSVLAGFLSTADGDRVFCVAAPGVGSAQRSARRAEQQWVLELVERGGGARPGACPSPVVFSDQDVVVGSPGASSM
jgi:D-alanyl-D-alanine carboxypeptidase/D-alanyl-D-alanine-endopeptidase (penicillin-binding protein 4)